MTVMSTPLVKVLGDKTAKALAPLHLLTVGDLLHHYPRRYVERGKLTAVEDLREGDHVTVLAEVLASSVRTTRNNAKMADVVISDGRGVLKLLFFGRTAGYHVGRLPVGQKALFAGTVSRFNQQLQLAHPDYQLGEEIAGFAGAIIPLYPASAAMPTWNIAKAVRMALDIVEFGDDPLPEVVRAQYALLDLEEAVRRVHSPINSNDIEQARTRLRWDEAFVLQVVLAQRRQRARDQSGTPRPGRLEGLLAAFDRALPFTLTRGQRAIGEELTHELAAAHPMHRLLQGEVGSGKTLVAIRAMLQVVDSGGQAALLAPTEVLAQQHARSITALLGPLATAGELGAPDASTRVTLLTGSLNTAARREALALTASGQAGIVIGTHALLSEGVDFADLGLVIVDEQHRFGVEQRDAMRAKGSAPHLLVMTATPIPRTVAMTIFGDLDVSVLAELPLGRTEIKTHVVPLSDKPQWRDTVWTRVRDAVSAGRQAFVVCPRIGGDEPAAQQPNGHRPPIAVVELLPHLAAGPLRGLRVEALHGRMAAEDKDDVMRRFAAGEIEVLVATTVIEVGVDVPNATIMVVMDPERFGVSQLHQLRGRVGRGEHDGLCLLVTEALAGSGMDRLTAVASTNDGFLLSEVDLTQRREGDVLGTEQSGSRTSLRMLRITDLEVIMAARELAIEIVQTDPELALHAPLAQAVRDLVDEQRAEFLEKG